MTIVLDGSSGITTPDLTSTDDITANSATVLTSASSIPASNLTGSLPAIDGSALTGVGGVTSLNGQTGAITNTSFNVIGSVAASNWRDATAPGGTVSGSNLTYAYWSGSAWSAPSLGLSGTWRHMGGTRYGTGANILQSGVGAVFVRVS